MESGKGSRRENGERPRSTLPMAHLLGIQSSVVQAGHAALEAELRHPVVDQQEVPQLEGRKEDQGLCKKRGHTSREKRATDSFPKGVQHPSLVGPDPPNPNFFEDSPPQPRARRPAQCLTLRRHCSLTFLSCCCCCCCCSITPAARRRHFRSRGAGTPRK